MRPSKLLALASLLAALAIAGCGGGGDDTTQATVAETTEAPASLSKEDLISQGDAICSEVNAAIGSIGASAADTQTQVTQTADLYTGMVESILELGTPDESAGYSDFIQAAEQLAKVEGEAKLAAEREDTEALGAVATEAAPILEEFQAQAAIYGFEDCSEGPSAPTAAPSAGGGEEEVEEGGVEAAPEVEEEVAPEEAAPEEVAPETGGAGGGVEEEAPAPETGGGGTESGGVGPG
ncbi:MAG TPA: hypothetical protein VFX45_11270 [Solirubrobacterales bacterium]|nr:hypothetical protein [Solirubrobacterales bacterium]